MRVVGRYKTIYECNTASKVKEVDGSVYIVQGRNNCKVKVLDKSYCTKAREQELNGILNGEVEWFGPQIIDIVYSHGKFVGYLYEEEQISDPVQPEISQNISEPSAKIASSTLDMPVVKIIYAVTMVLALGAFTYFSLFEVYINLVESIASSEMAYYCYTFNFSGITGIIGGTAGVFLASRSQLKNPGSMYYMLIPLGYLGGMVIVFLVVTIIILLIRLVISAFIAVIPIVIMIAAILYVVKLAFKR